MQSWIVLHLIILISNFGERTSAGDLISSLTSEYDRTDGSWDEWPLLALRSLLIELGGN